jgi:hypothetical protein
MMGHTVDTYNDIQSVGIDKLRIVYAAAGLSIKPKTQVSKLDMLKEMMRAYGMNPEEFLTRNALTKGAITEKQDQENYQLAILRSQLRQLIRDDTPSV